ncbi:2-oxoacid ferredoxin oxidoreductase [Poriferisphaera corsica]|uniref:Indolepyruvate oxidoreductase subunit IorA n=1 Tax=Poriferisphaera corsica TaxID=2528020 RepID=A0A517YPC6_9BACT|nr:indolepyruvate ferredoxin oxidoreductase subunit alpha [Poriferisphaera corsica]QDU32084.1 2-oxoacid ferredoxin oxidoreductase [Poriferisphaera corsica]
MSELKQDLLSGNDAYARGAWEAGVTVAAGYPGTPSTEILEALAAYKQQDLHCEWSPNEKVALEVGAGAALTGARVLVTMKHVGLNVAADPFMTLAYTGCVGGIVILVADDPGMHSSQNEQDTRHFARFGKVPILEPSDATEAKDMMKRGFEISEQFKTPVIVRSTTRVSHSRGLVDLEDRQLPETKIGFQKNPRQFVPVPAFARQMRVDLEKRLHDIKDFAETDSINRIEYNDKSLGIITSSTSYLYVKEVWPEASVLKLGMAYPFADKLFKEFSENVDNVLVIEELDDFYEEHIKALGIKCDGKNFVPNIGEFTQSKLAVIRAKYEGKEAPNLSPVEEAADLPMRPPTLCPGCPHRGMFTALRYFDCIVTGDIGCYALGVAPPLSRIDTILCMGGGFTMAHGMDRSPEPKKVVGILGDSTFFHSGITGLCNIAYNKGTSIIIVLDNRTTAMTGHQDHPGTGKTLMGDPTQTLSIEKIGEACGIKRIFSVDPRDIDSNVQLLKQEFEVDEPTLIVAKYPCVLNDKSVWETPREIDQDLCVSCGNCVQLGCPAIEYNGEIPKIEPLMCTGCSLCENVCELDLINAQGTEK